MEIWEIVEIEEIRGIWADFNSKTLLFMYLRVSFIPYIPYTFISHISSNLNNLSCKGRRDAMK